MENQTHRSNDFLLTILKIDFTEKIDHIPLIWIPTAGQLI